MTEDDWKKLSNLTYDKDPVEYERLLDLTLEEYEHPEWYDGNCCCSTCCSYADYF